MPKIGHVRPESPVTFLRNRRSRSSGIRDHLGPEYAGAARSAGVFGVHYNASKAGMEGLTRGYAARLVKYGITVNAVAPSLIDTEMMASQRAESAARIPLGRLGTGEEVAAAVVMVASNAYITGQTVPVNGGLHFN